MSQGNTGSGSSAIPASLLVALLGIGGWVLIDSPLQSERHNEFVTTSGFAYHNKVEARLWQDPLQAVQDHWQPVVKQIESKRWEPRNNNDDFDVKALDGVLTTKKFSNLIKKEISATDQQERVMLVPVLLRGGWYANNVETRRRQRHALITAFASNGYSPKEPERLSFFLHPDVSLTSNTPTAEEITQWQPIPYEWLQCTHSKCADDRVLVLWVAMASSNEAPLKTLATLTSMLGHGKKSEDSDVRILGPASSVQLQKMINEVSSIKQGAATRASQSDATSYEPNPQKLPDFSDKQTAEQMLELADTYLDQELAELDTEELGDSEACLAAAVAINTDGSRWNSEQLEGCLIAGVFASLEDSDDDWRSSLLGLWQSQLQQLSPIGVAEHLVKLLEKETIEGLDLSSSQASRNLSTCLGSKLKLSNNLLALDGTKSAAASCIDAEVLRQSPQQAEEGLEETARQRTTQKIAKSKAIKDWLRSIQLLGDWFPPRKNSLNDNTRSLLLAAHNYLDAGLPLGFTAAKLDACLNPQTNGSQTEKKIENCFKDEANGLNDVEDSDSDWQKAVAEQWFVANSVNEANDGQYQGLTAAKFFSARSTQPWDAFDFPTITDPPGGTDEASRDQGDLVSLFRSKNLPISDFHSVISRDDATIQLLVDELDRRGLCVPSTEIYLVHELETGYGRAMSSTFEKLLTEIDLDEPNLQQNKRVCLNSKRIKKIGYLQGVDGEILGETTTSDSNDKASNSSESEMAAVASQHLSHKHLAAGRSQLDYIQRLAQMISSGPKESAENSATKNTVVAILGSDVYDKLLLMQAIKQSAPDSLFVTLDLDARLLSADQLPWTRNLLIGSAYGLQLSEQAFKNEKWGARDGQFSRSMATLRSPPFRDSYQTAFFVATRSLIENGQRQLSITPKLFEVGRNGAIDLTVAHTNGKSEHFTESWVHQADKEPQRFFTPNVRAMLLLLPCWLALLLWGYQRTNLPRNGKYNYDRERLGFNVAMALVAVTAVWLWLLLSEWQDPAAEPWLLFEGVSAVPVWMLRIQIAVLCVAALVVAYCRFQQNGENLGVKFFNRKDFDRGIELSPWIFRWNQGIDGETRLGSRISKPAKIIWASYRGLGTLSNRSKRVLWPLAVVVVALVVVSLGFSLDIADSSTVMRDGIGICSWNLMTTLALLFALLLLSWFALDALKLGQTFIRALGRYELTWESELDAVGELPADFETDASPSTLDAKVRDALTTMDLLVYHTERLLPLIMLPFAMMFLVLISRNELFEGAQWSPLLSLSYGLIIAVLLLRATLLQREAQRTKARLVTRIERHASVLAGTGVDWDRTKAQTDGAADYIRGVHRGAFVEWYRHPIIQSILLPLGGVVSLVAVQSLG